MPKTNIYVDGFNLYYGIRETARHCKWLDIEKLCTTILPHSTVNRVRYFTANVKPRADDPDCHLRQAVYLRALGTISNISIHKGEFLSKPVRMRLESPPPVGPATISVIKTEEKGSDVNLASFLLCDAFDNEFETAVVVSNDSDLVTPISIVRERFKRDVIVLNPHKKPSVELAKVATFIRPIRAGALEASQFLPRLTTKRGIITKPALWDQYAWCASCKRVELSARWRSRQCPSCRSADAEAWSVIRITHLGYPAVPISGTVYPQ